MMSKEGHQEYLGIKIDYDSEKKLNEFSLETLKDRYFWKEETYAQESFARAAVFGATFKGVTDYSLAQRLYNYANNNWFMFRLLYFLTGEPLVAYLSLAFLIMFPIRAVVYLITTMKTYGWHLTVAVSVDIGVLFGAMVWLLLTIAALLDLSLSCM